MVRTRSKRVVRSQQKGAFDASDDLDALVKRYEGFLKELAKI